MGRPAHGKELTRLLERAELDSVARRSTAGVSVTGAKTGLYIEIDSQPNVPLATSSLQDLRKGIEVTNQRDFKIAEGETETVVQRATVFVPDGQLSHFVKRLEAYSLSTPRVPKERRYEDTFDRVASLRLATLRALWTDDESSYPSDQQEIWWEVWLRRTDEHEIARFEQFAQQVGVQLGKRHMLFIDRVITLVKASPEQLAASIDVLCDLAELRRAKDIAAFLVDESSEEQGAWVRDLTSRLTTPPNYAPAVCILDTGVTQGHPLLAPALAVTDLHAVDPTWGKHDHDGHGTEMAGLALLGDLGEHMGSASHIVLSHRLESVKILPPEGENPPELYGAITAAAVSYPEVQEPERTRVFSMAITSRDQRDRGQPTSWSSAVDALAVGRSIDAATNELTYISGDARPRLFVLSAGNVEPPEVDHLTRSDIEPVHDPAQSWNALTVGAFTARGVFTDDTWRSWEPLTKPGELSVWSSTSVGFARNWPIKPDVVAEGGNVVVNGQGEIDFPVPELSLLTTHFRPGGKALTLSWATSAACAQVARICARIASQYPQIWPEATRALVVHSAEWTAQMKERFSGASTKRDRMALVRRYGFGVASETRALKSARDCLTLVAQATIRPFSSGKLREMHLYELPWPKTVLESLQGADVKLRVTLSYFVEPNPARRGRVSRFRYQSHGLRFAVKGQLETIDEFRKRINLRAREEEEGRPRKPDDDGWFLGDLAQRTGSLHSDVWHGSAADLAERGVIAVFPVSGWWKDLKKHDRSDHGARYALVVSIETAAVNVDIWTPVAVQVGTLVPIATTSNP